QCAWADKERSNMASGSLVVGSAGEAEAWQRADADCPCWATNLTQRSARYHVQEMLRGNTPGQGACLVRKRRADCGTARAGMKGGCVNAAGRSARPGERRSGQCTARRPASAEP